MPQIAQALSSLLVLPPNWDSYGAQPIDPRCIEYARTLLRSIMKPDTPAPAVVPTSQGGVQLEWHTKGLDLEIEVRSPEQCYVLYENHRDGTTWEGELTADLTQLRQFVSNLSR